MMHPIELRLDRDILIAETEMALQELREFTGLDRENLSHRHYVKASMQQCVDFLAWLRQQPDGRILMCLYPAKEAAELLAELPETDDYDEDDIPLF